MRHRLETAGRAIFQGFDCPRPSAVTILTITRTIISSIMAVAAIKAPIEVFCKLADASIMNVDPNDVEHRETPAEKAANAVGYPVSSTVLNFIPMIENDNAIGTSIPTIAAENVIHIVFCNSPRSVISPPSNTKQISPRYPRYCIVSWVSIAKPRSTCDGHSKNYTDKYLADESAVEELVKNISSDVEYEYES
ncbi:hypothetical protein EYC84_008501 [Monilinia fructicola]|uniref:Uncharacterized protein n=1 Tax=Monilinia fructicola TaxID=38448 RepID=A0A5M9JJU2_MONFR|nr:hypothetical protein EYC84_008501 [Monilinia fructicola]